jgi:thiol-disulfide isomerase/thioredoxin
LNQRASREQSFAWSHSSDGITIGRIGNIYMKRNMFLTVCGILLFVGSLAVRAGSLAVGSSAPAINVGKWLKGKPIEKLDTQAVYVIEFWATWCPPCRRSIPHLTEIAKKYEGKVEVVGVSVYEHEASEAARLSKVGDFVKSMGEKMDYHVAVDNSQTFMAKEWMEAANQEGIPAAFIVKGGKIVWIGHPMQGLDEELAKLTKSPGKS